MKKWLVLCLILVLGSVVPLFSADLSLDYLEGYLDIQKGEDWEELMAGDSVPETAVVKLDEDSVAELMVGSRKITLMRPGIYRISDLLSSSGQQQSVGLGSLVGRKLKTILVEAPQQSQTAVMGVRGAKQENEVQWMSSDTAELLKTGKTFLNEGKADEAIESFEEAFDFADEADEAEVLFYLGYAYVVAGNLPKAMANLDDVEPDPEKAYFPDFVLLMGQLLTEAFAHEDAIEWLSLYAADLSENAPAYQMALLLQGINHSSMSDSEKATQSLKKAIEIDAGSETGKVAAAVLSQIQ